MPPFPDLTAQLDLWTNLNFQSDEPLIPRKDSQSDKSSEDESDRYNLTEEELQSRGKVAEASSHENVVTGTVIPPAPPVQQQPPAANLSQLPQFDIGSLLAGFGIDPFHVPPVAALPQTPGMPSLAQLLAFNSAASVRPQVSIPGVQPPVQPASAVQSPQLASQAPSPSATYPTTKRARTTRPVEQSEPASPVSPEADEKSSSTPLTASEDKRRRNTAASARFRLKKKEREAALERKAKELEVRVGELEKECEALRRENGWLKGLVVGVTGAGAVQHQQQQQVAAAGAKRGRDDAETQVAGQSDK